MRNFILAAIICSLASCYSSRNLSLKIFYVKQVTSNSWLYYAKRGGVIYKATLHQQFNKGDKLQLIYSPTACDTCFLPIAHYSFTK